jgi:hypothetical protein
MRSRLSEKKCRNEFSVDLKSRSRQFLLTYFARPQLTSTWSIDWRICAGSDDMVLFHRAIDSFWELEKTKNQNITFYGTRRMCCVVQKIPRQAHTPCRKEPKEEYNREWMYNEGYGCVYKCLYSTAALFSSPLLFAQIRFIPSFDKYMPYSRNVIMHFISPTSRLFHH